MAEDAVIKFNDKQMTDLISSLKKDFVLRVGILGGKASSMHDGKSGKTNAEIGTYHEFGTRKMPRRSFLEDSLKLRLKFNSSQFQQMRKNIFNKMFLKNKPQEVFQDLGIKCLEIIQEAFNTNGFGKWQQLSDRRFDERWDKALKNYNRIERAMVRGKIEYDKNTLDSYLREISHPHILTDTGKLRNSISFKVIKRK